jgi:hypothetical protein
MPPAGFEPAIPSSEQKGTSGIKVQIKFSLEQAMKAQRGSRGIALLFL